MMRVGFRPWLGKRLEYCASVLHVLVAARIHDIRNEYSSDVVVEDKSPHDDDCDREPVAYVADRLVL